MGHRSLGFVAFIFAVVALETGSHISSVHQDGYEHLSKQNEKYSIGLIVALLATAIVVTCAVQVAIRIVPTDDGQDDHDPSTRSSLEIEHEATEISPLLNSS
jgi:hypothetical protein